MFTLSTLVTRVRAAWNATRRCARSRDAVLAEVGGAVVAARPGAEVDPAVSSRTTSRSVPSISSRLSGLASSSAGERPDGAQVRVEAEALAQAEQPLLGPRGARVGGVPLRPADGGEQDGVGGLAGGERVVGQRAAVGVDRGAAERVPLEGEVVATAASTSAPRRAPRARSRRRGG